MKYEIHHYPSHLIDMLHVIGCGSAIIRPTLPQDAQLHMSFVAGLSDSSRHNRFMTGVSELSQAMALYFSQVDYKKHFALLASIRDGGRETMVAEARYVVDEDDAETCEFAICVTDAWQGRGLGKNLLKRITQNAMASGLSLMRGETLSANHVMIGLAKRCGFETARDRSLVQMKISLVLRAEA